LVENVAIIVSVLEMKRLCCH